jgi:HAD superfamily hydrolase (TIGR01509 family)
MVEAVLCDIDGTLVESNWLHAEAWQRSFAEIGINVELDEVRRQIGKGGDELIPVFVSWWRRPAVSEPLKAYRKFLFESEYLSRVEPLPQAKEFLARLKAAGIRPALATSASAKDLATYKKLVGIDDLIEEESSSDDTDRAKPHPDIFAAVLKKLSLPASKVLALGDTPYDAEAAGGAGISTIGVMSGGWSREDLLEAGCIEVYRDVAELLHCFDQSALVR